jgi:hypothetical protein
MCGVFILQSRLILFTCVIINQTNINPGTATLQALYKWTKIGFFVGIALLFIALPCLFRVLVVYGLPGFNAIVFHE